MYGMVNAGRTVADGWYDNGDFQLLPSGVLEVLTLGLRQPALSFTGWRSTKGDAIPYLC